MKWRALRRTRGSPRNGSSNFCRPNRLDRPASGSAIFLPALIRAFRTAFTPAEPVDLVIKVSPQGEDYSDWWRELRAAAAGAGVRLIDRSMSREELLAYRPSRPAQERFNALLERSKQGSLSDEEEWELNQFEHLEMLMQAVKARLRTRRAVPS